jgi:hypothetical protein
MLSKLANQLRDHAPLSFSFSIFSPCLIHFALSFLRQFFESASKRLRQFFDSASTILRYGFDFPGTHLRYWFDPSSTAVEHGWELGRRWVQQGPASSRTGIEQSPKPAEALPALLTAFFAEPAPTSSNGSQGFKSGFLGPDQGGQVLTGRHGREPWMG